MNRAARTLPHSTARRAVAGVLVAMVILLMIEILFRLFNFTGRWGNQLHAFQSTHLYETTMSANNRPVMRTNPAYARRFHLHEFSRADDRTPPRTGKRFRAFAIGGSSAFGWGTNDPDMDNFMTIMKPRLESMFPGTRFELINASGISWGSSRIAVLTQELVRHRPDVIIVHMGHNEFWEYPIYRDVVIRAISIRKIAAWMEHSSLYAWMEDRVAHTRMAFGLTPGPSGHYERFDQAKYEAVRDLFEKNLRKVIRIATERDIRIILSTLPVNLKVDPDRETDWLRDSSHHRPRLPPADLTAWKRAYERARELMRKGRWSGARHRLLEVAALDPAFAKVWHDAAVCAENLGLFPEARENYWRHIDLSRRTVVREFNDIIRRLARNSSLPLFDAASVFEKRSKNRIMDYGLFTDSMHPNRKGHELLAHGFADLIQTERIVR